MPFQSDFYEEVIDALRAEILARVHNNAHIKGVIIDVSQVHLMDLADIHVIEQIMSMATLLGISAVLSGLQPGVAMTLIELGYDNTHLHIALNIEKAQQLIKKHKY